MPRQTRAGSLVAPYFENFKIGMKFKSRLGRTLTDVDNIWFTLLNAPGTFGRIGPQGEYTWFHLTAPLGKTAAQRLS